MSPHKTATGNWRKMPVLIEHSNFLPKEIRFAGVFPIKSAKKIDCSTVIPNTVLDQIVPL